MLEDPSHLFLAGRHPLPAAITGDLRARLEFIMEADRMKAVLRASPLAAEPRSENDAEHSWHLALMTMVLAEYANEPIDRLRCLEMVTIHDLVEIVAGDVPLHGVQEPPGMQEERERAGADVIFSMLPQPQASRFRAIWDEFEAHATAEAKFARSMDRLQPTLLNWMARGGTWRSPGVTADDVLERKAVIEDGSSALWTAAKAIILEGRDRGWSRS